MDHANPNQGPDANVVDRQISESTTSSVAETSSRRGSRTINACEQCQRRKTKCTGQPGPCEACEKMGLSCHFDSKTHWKTRPRATYSAEDGRLQYMLHAVLSALKYSDERVLNGLMTALRQNESPEMIALHLRSNMDILQEHGHIANIEIDQADLVSLASRVSNPAPSDVPLPDTSSNAEAQPYGPETAGLGISRLEVDSGISNADNWHQTDPVRTYQHQPSFVPGWNPAYVTTANAEQISTISPWVQTQLPPAQMLQHAYDDRQLDYTQLGNTMPPSALHLPYYTDPYSPLQPRSASDQFYPSRHDPTAYRPPASIGGPDLQPHEAGGGSLPILHEGMTSQLATGGSTSRTQQPSTRSGPRPSFSQSASSTQNQQRRKDTTKMDPKAH